MWLRLQARSLLSGDEGFTTLQFTSPTEILRPSFVYVFLKRYIPEEQVEQIRRISLTADGSSALFDVPAQAAKVTYIQIQRHLQVHIPVHMHGYR